MRASSLLLALPATFLIGLALPGCSSLPRDVSRTNTTALSDTPDTRLGRALKPQLATHPGVSGIRPLALGRDAFAARVVLAHAAQRSLDLQYYIWHRDTTGQLMTQAVWEAAERGVRVRLLLDDANTSGQDAMLAALDAHPNIEVRLFNPFANRGFRAGDFALDFSRVNRRMHNKSFTADNEASIVGGRNVGNEYFDAEAAAGFQDLDVLAVGPVVQEVSHQFDLYWNSPSAYPVASMLAKTDLASGTALLQAGWKRVHDEPGTAVYTSAVRSTPLLAQLLDGSLLFEWVPARVYHDDPAKVLRPPEQAQGHMLPELQRAMGMPLKELDLVSPYFVPGPSGTQGLTDLAKRGVQVRVLTNSLAATDVGPVHAGYARYREALLRGGVKLYELKPTAEDLQKQASQSHHGPGASSAVSLHAKTFAADRNRIFVGSFNLDPRSANLNTEMGVLIESPVLAKRLSEDFFSRIPAECFEPRLGADGKLQWVERTPEGEVVYTTEPTVGWMRRTWVDFLSVLPIEWLL